jgi:hypothetical protein
MHKNRIMSALALGALFCAIHPFVHAQATKSEAKDEAKASGPRPITAYRLDIAINELEDGKKVNTRHYSINTTSDSTPQVLQIGTRVPVLAGEKGSTYLNVGTRITARIAPWVTPMTLNVSADISSFALPEEASKTNLTQNPLLRQIEIEGTVPIVTDKPTVVGVVDDPGSKREYQLEVTVTKLN